MNTGIKTNSKLAAATVTKMALFIALMIVSGIVSIPLPVIGVPIVLQNMMIMLCGGFLGKKYGTLTNGLFLLLVFVGLPLLAGGRGGAAVFLSLSSGFLVGYLLCPLLINLFLQYLGDDHFWKIFLAYFIGGALVIDFMGSLSMAYYSHVSWAAGLKMVAVFLPMDTVKVVLATIIHQRLRKFTVAGNRG
ncbi:biotin transporter BioY [Agrilactobacillus yilanensis]|uniref:Biotin transporter n=1 Tax=Agrilactobacillus yilanensis TaxID=2485997 RepID=A0ABW4J6T0_9LACO|nr:biotin transporter BioY [Agrilactobacillus yilanensis]